MEYIDSEDRFISVKIPSFLVPMQSLSRRATEKYYLNNKTLNENDLIEITKQVIEATPIGQYKTLSSRNPGYSMFQKYFENYDSYRKEQVVQNEKGIYDSLIQIAGLHKDVDNNFGETKQHLKKRLELVEGEIGAGNTNPALKKELNVWSNKVITKNK